MRKQQETPVTDDSYHQLDTFRLQTNLTRNQLGFWLIQKVDNNDTSSNMGQCYEIHGTIEPDLFQQAFAAMLRETDAMRAQFSEREGVPHQEFADIADFALPIIELDEQQVSLHDWCQRALATPFNLGRQCFDSALLRQADDHWFWYLCVHHIIVDGYSMNLIFERVAAHYDALCNGAEADTNAGAFAEFTKTERAYRTSPAATRDREFWLAKSIGPASPTFYGNARRSDADQCTRHAVPLDDSLHAKLVSRVKEATSGTGNSDLCTLLAYLTVLSILYSKVADDRRISVGVPFHGRSSALEKSTVGLLMEVVPLSVEVHSSDTFSSLVRKWKNELFGSLKHCRYGSTNPTRARRYDVMINLVDCRTNDILGSPVTTRWVHSGHWNEALTAQVQHGADGIDSVLYLDLNDEVFPHPFSQHLLEHVSLLLAVATNSPNLAVSEIALMADSERTARKASWNDGRRQIENEENIVSHYEGIRKAQPDALAVTDGLQTVSYDDLGLRADRVARHLLAEGASPGDSIAMSVPRSIRMIEVLLGILKAGCHYVPIDPKYPQARIAAMLIDSDAKILCTDNPDAYAGSFPKLIVLNSDALGSGDQTSNAVTAWRSTTSNSCAYVNFTSGTTGRPKGVAVPHGGVIRLTAEADYVDLGRGVRQIHLSTISFDAATFEIWGPLLTGGTVVVHKAGIPSVASVRECISASSANSLFLTTSVFNAFVDEDIASLRGITQLLTGGEAASFRHMQRVRREHPEIRLIHAYGPTECTTYTTCFDVPAADRMQEPVPIGRPIANTITLVLDDNHREVPVGVVGTLFVGGDGLALEYLKQPEVTADKFVSVTHDGRGEVRLYDTGDRVRQLPSGDLVFVGREDNQIKLRGVRIEIEEIEDALSKVPAISQAVVKLHELADGTKGLAAFITCTNPDTSVTAVRSTLRSELPASSVPRWIEILEELPIGPTGKVDRKALPEPNTEEDIVEGTDDARDALDRDLLSIWSSILGVTVSSIDQNFFELGGDSINAIRIAARISKDAGVVEARDVLQSETVRHLADRLHELASQPEAANRPSAGAQVSQQDLDAAFTELDL